MRRHAWLHQPLLWLLLAAAGCDGDVDVGSFDGSLFDDAGNPPDEDASEPEPDAGMMGMDAGGDGDGDGVDEWPGQFAEAFCGALEDCLGAQLLSDALRGTDCASSRRNLLENGELAYLADSVAEGRVIFSSADLPDCLGDVRALGCAVRASRLPASCEVALLGTVDSGADCALNVDCAGDAFCDKGALATCPGTCAPLQAQGMPCNNNDDAQCEDGLVCFDGSCEPLADIGDVCGTGMPACRPGTVCFDQGSGLECIAIATRYFKELGDDCDVTGDLCEPGLVCESTSGTAGVCAEVVGAGAACKRAQPNQCPVSQYCDAENPGESGTCRDRPAAGEACLSRQEACADGHVCIDSTCRALAQVGDDCLEDGQCYSGLCDDSGKCEGALMCTL